MSAVDLTGHRYGRLNVSAFAGRGRSPGGQAFMLWKCVCDCGKEVIRRTGELRSRNNISCGCRRGETQTVHGYANKIPEYYIWKAMKRRCYTPSNKDFKNYGGRGITVCPEWQRSFPAFLSDMGPRPSASHTIDRIDPNGNYEPENCRWLLSSYQSANRRCAGNLDVICASCGNVFHVNAARYLTAKYCSRRCHHISMMGRSK